MAFVTRSSDPGTWRTLTIHIVENWVQGQMLHVRWMKDLGVAVLCYGNRKIARVSRHPSTGRYLIVMLHLNPAMAHLLHQEMKRVLEPQVLAMSHGFCNNTIATRWTYTRR